MNASTPAPLLDEDGHPRSSRFDGYAAPSDADVARLLIRRLLLEPLTDEEAARTLVQVTSAQIDAAIRRVDQEWRPLRVHRRIS